MASITNLYLLFDLAAAKFVHARTPFRGGGDNPILFVDDRCDVQILWVLTPPTM